ncbi:MAG: PIN domain-containing protein, partial [Egibacteraceae bacterium]
MRWSGRRSSAHAGNAADTSILIAAFASWHEGHAAALAALRGNVRLPAHAVVETYAVLTRLPPPHRTEGKAVAAFLSARFPAPPVVLDASEYVRLVEESSRHGITGGAIWGPPVQLIGPWRGRERETAGRRPKSGPVRAADDVYGRPAAFAG